MKQRIKLQRKGLFFIVVLLLCGLNTSKASAQEWDHEYVPFVGEGKVWNCLLADNDDYYNEDEPAYDCIFTMHGDTVIGERNYKKVYCEFEKHYGDKEQHYYCAVREESYKVFFFEQDGTGENLLCDFSSSQDSLIFSRGNNQYERSSEKHMYGNPKGPYMFYLIKKIKDSEKSDSCAYATVWAEGVGNLGNPFSLELNYDEPKLGSQIYVYSCMKDDKIIFENSWLDFPVLPLQIGTTPYTKPTSHNIHYDLQGRPVKATPKHGIYIKDGRKVMR